MNLKTIPTDQLEAELKRRNQPIFSPFPLEKPDVEYEQKLKDTCITYVKELFVNNYADEDLQHYIFEYAMQMVYGRNIFELLNQMQR